MAKGAVVAVAIMLATLMVLQALPTSAEIMSGTIENLPAGLELRREFSVERFMAREDERRCVTEKARNRGYYFVPVEAGEAGVTFDRCELGEWQSRRGAGAHGGLVLNTGREAGRHAASPLRFTGPIALHPCAFSSDQNFIIKV